MYIGRFAPTPSGPLHFGSIVTAMASYLDAKHNNGKWKVRIDDIDSPRILEGSELAILKKLENLGLHWDDKISRQSENIEEYKDILEILKKKSLTYNCRCSRKKILESTQSDSDELTYNNHCRNRQYPPSHTSSIRLIANYKSTNFNDRAQGPQCHNINNSINDFIIKRSDQLYAYQFTVVIDDELQSVNNIVRGTDLLNSTIKQHCITNILNFSKSWSNRFQFSNLLPILALTVFLVISIVKSSLALSLGLVGALSIVRFRTPIKEPEELLYLFIAIAVGLGLAANQTILTVIIFIFLILLILTISNKKLVKENDYNLIIEYKKKKDSVKIVTNIIKTNFVVADFVKYELLEEYNEMMVFRVSMKDMTELENLNKDLKENLGDYKLSYYENNILI